MDQLVRTGATKVLVFVFFMLDNLRDLLWGQKTEFIMSIKIASYAAFAAAEKQVSQEMQAFRQLYSEGTPNARRGQPAKVPAPAAKQAVQKKGPRAR
ncbi:hypothetical protein ACN4GL_04590 [Burkholderia pseudomallei]